MSDDVLCDLEGYFGGIGSGNQKFSFFRSPNGVRDGIAAGSTSTLKLPSNSLSLLDSVYCAANCFCAMTNAMRHLRSLSLISAKVKMRCRSFRSRSIRESSFFRWRSSNKLEWMLEVSGHAGFPYPFVLNTSQGK